MSDTGESSAVTITYDGHCDHDMTMPLYCGWEDHDHGSIGYACRLCGEQVFLARPWCEPGAGA